MLNKKYFFTAFFLTSITCMMLTVAEPRPSAPLNTNPQFERDKPVKGEKKHTPAFVAKEVTLKPGQFIHEQFLIRPMRKSKEKFSHLVSQLPPHTLCSRVRFCFEKNDFIVKPIPLVSIDLV